MTEQQQRGRTNRRRFLLITGLALPAVGGLTAYAAWPQPYRHEVRTEPEPLNRRFAPYLGGLTDAHWLGYDIDGTGDDRTIPSPDYRVRLVGVAHLPAGGAAAIVNDPGRTFVPAAPSALPAPLKPYLPAVAAWRHSPEFDAYANHKGSGSDASSSGRYLFDTALDLVHFDVLYAST
ncbi:hypothetical protein ACH4U5_03245 [Streptomyces sp. NPDC020858]|uniref:hypothetical protein n=1 Tax=Streptomyces sp. NPDC020858 TaxID=3365097 RepID=UPI0037B4D303